MKVARTPCSMPTQQHTLQGHGGLRGKHLGSGLLHSKLSPGYTPYQERGCFLNVINNAAHSPKHTTCIGHIACTTSKSLVVDPHRARHGPIPPPTSSAMYVPRWNKVQFIVLHSKKINSRTANGITHGTRMRQRKTTVLQTEPLSRFGTLTTCHLTLGCKPKGRFSRICILSFFTNFRDVENPGGFAQTIGVSETPQSQ